MICEEEIRPRHVKAAAVDRSGCETTMGEAQFPTPFHEGLKYGAPARGSWTIAHPPMLIPECHEIYVCCPCCLHGVVLSAEEVPGGFDRFSMVTVSNENLIKGNLEQMMIDGVADIILRLPKRPRCVECFTSCIQHFLHMDIKLVYRRLREAFPDIDFIDGYMIPTLQRKFSPDALGRRQLTRAILKLPPVPRSIGLGINYYPLDRRSELVEMFEASGWTVRDFAALKTYEDYRQLGSVEANLYFLPNGKPAAQELEKRLGQEAVYAPYSWNFEEIRENYVRLAQKFRLILPDCDALREECENALLLLKEEIGQTPIVLDAAATPRVLSLARLLVGQGFSVRAVYADAFLPEEEADFNWLKLHAPTLKVRAIEHYKMRLLPRTEAKEAGKLIAIGQKAAYFTGTSHFVNLIENGAEEGAGQGRDRSPHPTILYGYRGILRLADLMRAAYRQESDVPAIIQQKAWGCRG